MDKEQELVYPTSERELKKVLIALCQNGKTTVCFLITVFLQMVFIRITQHNNTGFYLLEEKAVD